MSHRTFQSIDSQEFITPDPATSNTGEFFSGAHLRTAPIDDGFNAEMELAEAQRAALEEIENERDLDRAAALHGNKPAEPMSDSVFAALTRGLTNAEYFHFREQVAKLANETCGVLTILAAGSDSIRRAALAVLHQRLTRCQPIAG